MKKLLALSFAVLTSIVTTAQNYYQQMAYEQTEPKQTYIDNVYENSSWNSNWFLSVKGGVSAFTGNPVGHGDLFDRQKPLLNLAIGKWLSPYVGGRLSFQGLQLTDGTMETRDYQNFHADFLYNIGTYFHKDFEEQPRWDVVVYGGAGLIRNDYNKQKPFALSYGLTMRYRLAKRLHLTAEIGNTTTWESFDGIGSEDRLGDHLLQASIGFDLTLGKTGWKRVIDAKPYMYQNEILRGKLDEMALANYRLAKKEQREAMALAEMRKILKIEGLLDKYNITDTDGEEDVKVFPKNNYSGLNALRERLKNKNDNNQKEDTANGVQVITSEDFNDNDTISTEDYFKVMKDGNIMVGAPVFFFFKLNTDELCDIAQTINIKEIARVIKKHGLYARVIGAADSQTGTPYGNERLSAKRADFIAKELKRFGVDEEHIKRQYRGGISVYQPQEGNRNSCVMLYYK